MIIWNEHRFITFCVSFWKIAIADVVYAKQSIYNLAESSMREAFQSHGSSARLWALSRLRLKAEQINYI